MKQLSTIIVENDLRIVAFSETHLDESIDSTKVFIQGYSIIRLDRNIYGEDQPFIYKITFQ